MFALNKLRKNKKGSQAIFGWILLAGTVLISVAFLVFVLSVMNTAIDDAQATTVFNNTIEMFVNFTAQLGVVGTIAGILLILSLLALVGLGVFLAGNRSNMF